MTMKTQKDETLTLAPALRARLAEVREALELLGECADGYGEEANAAYDTVRDFFDEIESSS